MRPTFMRSWFYIVCTCLSIAHFAAALDCTLPKQEWMRLRYTSMLVTISSSSPPNVCSIHGESCCDQQMERMMFTLGQHQVIQQARLNWLGVAEQMNNDSLFLENLFRTDLEQAKSRLHQFFSRIYGYNYKLHRGFFFQFFSDLEAYMAGQRSRLDHLVENFFNQLRDSIVGLIERSGQMRGGSNTEFSAGSASNAHTNNVLDGSLNSPMDDKSNEARRVRCLSDRVAQLKPFDDVDVRLKARMLDAYPPARMLINVLSVSGRLMSHLARQVSARPDCAVGMARFQFCAICAGKPLASVCPETCSNLLSSCLRIDGPDNVQLAAIWPRLIDAIVMAAMRLERSFNFAVVNRQLQMEISEAITSLQTRYEQQKSKLEAECNPVSSGRNVHPLFSSNSPNSRIPAPDRIPSMAGWPPNFGGFRGKRQAGPDPRYGQSFAPVGPSYASPELLNWQTRQAAPQANHFGGLGNIYGSPPTHTVYGHAPGGAPRPTWESPVGDAVSDVPERLARWASQMKHMYSALGNLFSVPGSNFCPAAGVRLNTNRTNSSSDCWNPPDLTPSGHDYGISKTLRVLSEAMERLHQASNNNADPEALSLFPTNMDSPDPLVNNVSPHMNSAPSPFNAPTHTAGNPPVVENPWGMQPAPPQYTSFGANELPGNLPEGSGMGPSDWNAPSMPQENTHMNFYQGNIQHMTTPNTPYGVQDPVSREDLPVGSGYGEYQPYAPYRPTNIEDVNQISYSRDNQKKADYETETRAQPHNLASTVQYPTIPTTTMTSTQIADTITTQSPAFMVPHTTTFTPASTTATTVISEKEPVTVQSVTPWYTRASSPVTMAPPIVTPTVQVRESDPAHYRGLPDDEDSVVEQEVYTTRPTPPPVFQPPSWPRPQNTYSQPTWWNEPYLEGSGRGEHQEVPNQSPNRGNNYDWDMGKPDSYFPETPDHYYPGSGQNNFPPLPDQTLPRPSLLTPRPDTGQLGSQDTGHSKTWSTYVQNPLQPYPVYPGSGALESAWIDNKPENAPGFESWKDGHAGSGSSNLEDTLPVPEIKYPSQTVDVAPQFPVQQPVATPKPSLAFPPRPPPEVWVPAQLAPGQPIPSVLLVREYNVQEPFYGPEGVHLQPSAAATVGHLITFTTLIVIFQCMF